MTRMSDESAYSRQESKDPPEEDEEELADDPNQWQQGLQFSKGSSWTGTWLHSHSFKEDNYF